MRVGSVPGKPYKVLLGYSMFMSFWSTLSGCVCGKGAEAKIIYVPCIKVLKARETEKEKIKLSTISSHRDIHCWHFCLCFSRGFSTHANNHIV